MGNHDLEQLLNKVDLTLEVRGALRALEETPRPKRLDEAAQCDADQCRNRCDDAIDDEPRAVGLTNWRSAARPA